MRKLTAFLLATTLAGCAIGPDHARPDDPAMTSFTGTRTGVFSDAEPVGEFWNGFDDPMMARLVERALAENTDLRVALARLDRARAISRESLLDLFPTITASGGYAATGVTAEQAQAMPRGRYDETNTGSVDAFWELDVLGRVRRAVEAQRADAMAAAGDLQALQVSIAAEVARTYMELRGAQEQLRVARSNAVNQRSTLNLTQTRLDAGRGTEFDTARARGQLESTLALIPALETDVAVASHRLAVLTGQQPSALLTDLEEQAPIPSLPERVAVGKPSDLIRRRPDVQAAEMRLKSATARIGVATADLFPRLVVNGSISTSAASFGDLFTGASEAYSLGPRISWAFLDLERVRTRIAAADADAAGALATYQGTVLRALEESENALVTYRNALSESEHLRQSADAAKDAAELARTRFDGGVADFLEVLDAERSLLTAEDNLARSRIRTSTALVAVYKALAGGWPERATELAQSESTN